MRKVNLLMFLIFFASVCVSFSQTTTTCETPIGIGNPVINHATCEGNGRVIVRGMNPVNASYQKALMDTVGNIYRVWQDNDTFLNVTAGHYDIAVRKICQPGFSGVLKRRVVIQDQTIPLNVYSIRQLRKDACGNGQIQINSVQGRAPYSYALMNSISAADLSSNMIRPKQSSNIFNNLTAGIYYVRVYDACGNYKTQQFEVETMTDTLKLLKNGNGFFTRINCDTFQYSISIENQNLFYGDVSTVNEAPFNNKFWIEFPNGHVDTFENVRERVRNKIPMEYMADSINANEPFPYNMNWPVVLKVGYMDDCGIVYTNDTLEVPIMEGNGIRMFYNSSNFRHPNCDSLYISFSFGNGNAHNQAMGPHVLWSLDSLNWQVARDDYANSSDVFGVKAGTEYTIWMNYCGRILKRNFQTPVDTREIVTKYNINANYSACFGNAGWHMTIPPTGNNQPISYQYFKLVNGDTINITDVSQITHTNNGNQGEHNLSLHNVEPAEYLLTVYDTLGAECPVERTFYRDLRASALEVPIIDLSYTCDGALLLQTNSRKNGTGLLLNEGWGGALKMEIVGHEDLGHFSGVAGLNHLTSVTIPATIMNNLSAGAYQIRYWNSLAVDTTCTYDGILDIVHTYERLDLGRTKFIRACSGDKGAIIVDVQGGEAPYVYSLYEGSIDEDHLIASSAIENIFEDLDLDKNYIISISDNCGNASSFAISNAELDLPLYHNYIEMPCEGDDFELGVYDLENVTYQWYKDGVPLVGEESSTFTIDNISATDMGSYKVEMILDNCAIHSNIFDLNLGLEECGQPLTAIGFEWSLQVQNGNNVHISWSHLLERVEEYVIEFSQDGSQWSGVRTVKAEPIQDDQYEFVHKDLKEGFYFYRMAIFKEGQYYYTNVKHAFIGTSQQEFMTIVPNPTRDNFYVKGADQEDVLVVMNSLGQEVLKVDSLSGQGLVNIGMMKAGIYYVTIYRDGVQVFQEKLTKL